MRKLINIYIFLISFTVFSQDKAVNNYALIKGIVSGNKLYSGLVNVSIPLYQMNLGNGLALASDLTYESNGFRHLEYIIKKEPVTGKLFIMESYAIKIRIEINNTSSRFLGYLKMLTNTEEKQDVFCKAVLYEIHNNATVFLHINEFIVIFQQRIAIYPISRFIIKIQISYRLSFI